MFEFLKILIRTGNFFSLTLNTAYHLCVILSQNPESAGTCGVHLLWYWSKLETNISDFDEGEIFF